MGYGFSACATPHLPPSLEPVQTHLIFFSAVSLFGFGAACNGFEESQDNETVLPDLGIAGILRKRVRYFASGGLKPQD